MARRCETVGFILLALGIVPGLGAQADFKVDVNLVTLNVTVADHNGKSIHDLPQDAFRVYEDGTPQQIRLFRHEDIPVAVGLVVDNSGSMRRKVPDVIAAATEFARLSNPQDQMFVVNFNEHVSLGLPEGEPFVSDPNELKAALEQIRAKGQTALYDAIARAFEHIGKSPLEKKVVIVLSDGGDNVSRTGFPQVLTMLEESNVIVYTVGLFDDYDTDRNPGVLKRLARMSGGEAFFPTEIPDVMEVLQAVSRDIRSQYTIGYVPSNRSRDGTYRSVNVKLVASHANRWLARTRAGYVALPPASAISPPETKDP